MIPSLVLLAAALASPTSTWTSHLDAGPFPGAPTEAALAFAAREPRLAGLEWEPVADNAWQGRHRVRLQARHQGIPVIGAVAIVQVEADNRISVLNAARAPVPDVSLTPSIPAAHARRLALDPVPGEIRAETEPALALLPGRGLVWEMTVWTTDLGVWRVRVDARTGQVAALDDLRRLAMGRVYAENPTNTPDLAEVELPGLPADATTLTGTWVTAWNTTSGSLTGATKGEQYAVADVDGNFYYDPLEGSFDDPFVEVEVYYQLTRLAMYIANDLGHTFPGMIHGYGNYTVGDAPFDNAFSAKNDDGSYLIGLGQGTVDFGYDADVMHHELAHGVVDDLADLDSVVSYPWGFDIYGMAFGPNAINEGMADYFAASFNGNSALGEYVGSAFGMDTLRDLDNGFTCPADVWGEGHMDGEMVGGTTWEIHEALGGPVTDRILYGALGLITSNPSFQEYGQAMVATAEALVADGDLVATDVQTLQDILDQRGFSRCGRSLELTDGGSESSHWLGADSIGDLMGGGMGSWICDLGRTMGVMFPLPFQYSFTVPEGVTSATVDVTLAESSGGAIEDGDLDYTAWIRKSELMTFTAEDFMGMGYTLVTGADAYDTEVTGTPSSIPLTGLEPGATYYVALAGLNCPVLDYTLTLHLEGGAVDTGDTQDTAAPEDTGGTQDTGGAPDDKDEGGCGGCATGRGTGAGALAWALATLLAGRRRRSVQ